MAGIGIGIGMGFGGGGRKAAPPNVDDIDRRFLKRDGLTLIDSIANRDATIYGEVSEFDGIDGSVDLGRPEFLNFIPQIDAFEIEGWFKINNGSIGTLYSFGAPLINRQIQIFAEPDDIGIWIGGNLIKTLSFAPDGNSHKLRLVVPASNSGIVLYIDDTLQDLDNYLIGSATSTENGYFGARTDGASFLLTGDLWDWKFYSGNGINRELVFSCPLPHKGIGFTPNGSGYDTVPLTVNGGVTQGFSEFGSTYCLDNGFVERNPELATESPYDIPFGDQTEGIAGLNIGSTYTLIIDGLSVGEDTRFANNGWISAYNGTQTFVASGNQVVFRDFAESQTSIGISIKLSTPDKIPNKPNKESAYPIVEGDTLVSGSATKLNTADSVIDMSRPNGAEAEEVVNGGFDYDGDWIKDAGWTISGGKAINDGLAAGEISQDAGILHTTKYIVSINGTGPVINVRLSGTYLAGAASGSSKAYTSGTSGTSFGLQGGGPFSIDNVSVKLAAPEILFFDKSDSAIWKQPVRDSIHYNSNNPFEWHSSERNQQFLYDNIQDAYKYQLWIKIQNNQMKDFFLYSAPLEGENICKAKKYVDLGEIIETPEADEIPCKLDRAQ